MINWSGWRRDERWTYEFCFSFEIETIDRSNGRILFYFYFGIITIDQTWRSIKLSDEEMKDWTRERIKHVGRLGQDAIYFICIFGIWLQQYRVGTQGLFWAATTKARRSNDIALACENRFKQQQREISIIWLLCKCSDAKYEVIWWKWRR